MRQFIVTQPHLIFRVPDCISEKRQGKRFHFTKTLDY